MGSFYSNCTISKTTIVDGMETYAQLLIPTNRGSGWDKGLQIYESPEFLPFGFPIKGEYADYGRIRGWVRDKNIEKIEEFFNLPIEEVMVACSRSGWETEIFTDSWNSSNVIKDDKKREERIAQIKNREILEKMNICHINAKVYDFMCEGWQDLITDESKVGKYDGLNREFSRSWKSIKRSSISEEEKEKELNDIIDQLIKEKNLDEESAKRMALVKQLSVRHHESDTYLGRYINQYDFIKLMKYRTEDFGDDFKKQFMFLTTMSEIGQLTPSMYGTQEDNFLIVRRINEVVNEFLDEEISRSIEEGDWRYDEEISRIKYGKRDNVIKDILSKDYDIIDVSKIVTQITGEEMSVSEIKEILSERS